MTFEEEQELINEWRDKYPNIDDKGFVRLEDWLEKRGKSGKSSNKNDG